MPVHHLLAGAVPAVAHVTLAAQGADSYALTSGRLWSIVAIGLALVGVVIGGLTLARPGSRIGTDTGRLGAVLTLGAGLAGAVAGALVVATSGGQLGTGGGLAGGVIAIMIGLVGAAVGGLALARAGRSTT
ncbi:DUF6223 family protein [Promicromonospora aerolata]|uniref:DUF6223 family protein n=1 Tax=Promicromonospora aerolata TaxID=195749 RepID=A0ABW4VGH6_9MICO